MEQENLDVVSPADEAAGAEELQATIDELTVRNQELETTVTELSEENTVLSTSVDLLTEQNESLYSSLSDMHTTMATLVEQNQTSIAQAEKIQYTLSIFLCFLVLYTLWIIGKIFYRFLSSFF